MFPPTKRLSYFDHQFLRVDDFTAEQAYHLGMRRAHNRMLHTPGVAQGLVVGRAGATVTVTAGAAIDGQGREIMLTADAELPVRDELAGKTAYVVIAYGERATDPTTETGVRGDRRWEEIPLLDLSGEAPDDPETDLVLGRVTIDAARNVTAVDDGVGGARRRAAGIPLGAELQARSLVVEEHAEVRGRLSAAGSLAVGGVAAPDATLHVAGGRSFATTDGDLKVGTGGNQLKVGVVVSGASAGEARLRAEGAAPRLILGAAGADVLTVSGTGVGVGAAPAAGALLTVGGVLNATQLRQDGAPVVSSQWSAATGGIAYTAGRVGIGVPSPEARLDVGERIRVRGTSASPAGVWLHQSGPGADRALVGMNGDNLVGLYGTAGVGSVPNAGTGLNMDVATGNVGVRTIPTVAALTVNGNVAVTGNVTATGRVSDVRVRKEAMSTEIINITNINNKTVWHNIPDMSLSFTAPDGAFFLVRFHMGGVQTSGVKDAHAEFRLVVNERSEAYGMEEYHNLGMELRGVTLERLLTLSGTQDILVQWSVRSLMATETAKVVVAGCHFRAHRTLMAIEL